MFSYADPVDPPLFSLPSPLSEMVARTFSSVGRFLPRPKRRSACSVVRSSMAGCDSNYPWVSILLQALIPAVHARAARDPLDLFMDDLASEESPQAKNISFSTIHPAVDRVVAIGDVHGDVDAMRAALRTASIINEKDEWVGGRAALVQVGDQLDRGHRERDIYDLLFRLQDKAPRSGGAVHILLGNHELMNSRLDFRYVTRGGFEDFNRDGGVSTAFGKFFRPRVSSSDQQAIRMLPALMRARARSLAPGGPLAAELAQRARIGVVIGDTLFVHGGLNTKHIKFGGRDERNAISMLEDLNYETRRFLEGKGDYPMLLHGSSSPIWMRDYSRPALRSSSAECRMLADTLKLFGVKRMIVGHTPQAEGINAACGGRVWRIDTGMSQAYGGVPEAIEISRRGHIKIHTLKGTVQGSARCN